MAKTIGYAKYTCDRCAKEAFIVDGDPAANKWNDVQRITADGMANTYLLCDTCRAAYRTVSSESDAAFTKFMTQGKDSE